MTKITSKRRTSLFRVSTALLCLASLFLILAAAIPGVVYTSLRGEYSAAGKSVKVDMYISQGLFSGGVCHGKHRPDDDVLKKLGIDCSGHKQTKGCNKDDLPKAFKERCEDFHYMQGNAIAAIIFSIFAFVLATRSVSGLMDNDACKMFDRYGGPLLSLIALCCAAAVLGRIKDSDIGSFNEKNDGKGWGCSKYLGTELCHEYGPSYHLEAISVAFLAIVFVCSLFLAVTAPDSSVDDDKNRQPELLSGLLRDAESNT